MLTLFERRTHVTCKLRYVFEGRKILFAKRMLLPPTREKSIVPFNNRIDYTMNHITNDSLTYNIHLDLYKMQWFNSEYYSCTVLIICRFVVARESLYPMILCNLMIQSVLEVSINCHRILSVAAKYISGCSALLSTMSFVTFHTLILALIELHLLILLGKRSIYK